MIQIYHAFFTIGGFLAPFLVQLFKSSEPLKDCGGEESPEESTNSTGDSYWDNLDRVGNFVFFCLRIY